MPQDTGNVDLFGVPTAPTPAPKPKTAPAFYIVPSGTRATECRGDDCAALVYWVKGYPAPISCDVEGGVHPNSRIDPTAPEEWPAIARTMKHDGRGLSHFVDCVNADQFSTSTRKRDGARR